MLYMKLFQRENTAMRFSCTYFTPFIPVFSKINDFNFTNLNKYDYIFMHLILYSSNNVTSVIYKTRPNVSVIHPQNTSSSPILIKVVTKRHYHKKVFNQCQKMWLKTNTLWCQSVHVGSGALHVQTCMVQHMVQK